MEEPRNLERNDRGSTRGESVLNVKPPNELTDGLMLQSGLNSWLPFPKSSLVNALFEKEGGPERASLSVRSLAVARRCPVSDTSLLESTKSLLLVRDGWSVGSLAP